MFTACLLIEPLFSVHELSSVGRGAKKESTCLIIALISEKMVIKLQRKIGRSTKCYGVSSIHPRNMRLKGR